MTMSEQQLTHLKADAREGMDAMSEGYAFNFDGHGTFTPDGKTRAITDAEVAAHNRELEARELEAWSAQPEQWLVYVSDSGTQSAPRDPRYVRVCAGDEVHTWLGTKLGTITYARTYHHNFGSRMTSIRFKGTNGATYYGRFGSDWSQACRVRKAKRKAK